MTSRKTTRLASRLCSFKPPPGPGGIEHRRSCPSPPPGHVGYQLAFIMPLTPAEYHVSGAHRRAQQKARVQPEAGRRRRRRDASLPEPAVVKDQPASRRAGSRCGGVSFPRRWSPDPGRVMHDHLSARGRPQQGFQKCRTWCLIALAAYPDRGRIALLLASGSDAAGHAAPGFHHLASPRSGRRRESWRGALLIQREKNWRRVAWDFETPCRDVSRGSLRSWVMG